MGLKLKKIVVLNGGYEKTFEVGKDDISNITKNPEDESAYIVFLNRKYDYDYKEIDVKAQNILTYWGY